MPVYEFTISAKINIRMDGETPEQACANLESLIEDSYMSIPCSGHAIKFGIYPAEVWVNDTKPMLKRQMPEGYDPINPPRMTAKKWHDMMMERQDGPVDEESVNKDEQEP